MALRPVTVWISSAGAEPFLLGFEIFCEAPWVGSFAMRSFFAKPANAGAPTCVLAKARRPSFAPSRKIEAADLWKDPVIVYGLRADEVP